jgi:endogenous inhibitor of DNA gyrase (YacG/DUF329 family)
MTRLLRCDECGKEVAIKEQVFALYMSRELLTSSGQTVSSRVNKSAEVCSERCASVHLRKLADALATEPVT